MRDRASNIHTRRDTVLITTCRRKRGARARWRGIGDPVMRRVLVVAMVGLGNSSRLARCGRTIMTSRARDRFWHRFELCSGARYREIVLRITRCWSTPRCARAPRFECVYRGLLRCRTREYDHALKMIRCRAACRRGGKIEAMIGRCRDYR